jgi:hypothetical protein
LVEYHAPMRHVADLPEADIAAMVKTAEGLAAKFKSA